MATRHFIMYSMYIYEKVHTRKVIQRKERFLERKDSLLVGRYGRYAELRGILDHFQKKPCQIPVYAADPGGGKLPTHKMLTIPPPSHTSEGFRHGFFVV
jgi:hypothetical protein